MMKTIVSNCIVILLFVLLETAILTNIQILPAIPDLLLMAVLYSSIYNGSLMGESFGFFSGLLLDFLSAAPLGLNCLIRTVVGAIAGLFNRTLNTSAFLLPALIGFCATLIKALILWIIRLFFPAGTIIAYSLISKVFLCELAMNTLFTPLIFSFLSIFSSFLVYKPEKIRL